MSWKQWSGTAVNTPPYNTSLHGHSVKLTVKLEVTGLPEDDTMAFQMALKKVCKGMDHGFINSYQTLEVTRTSMNKGSVSLTAVCRRNRRNVVSMPCCEHLQASDSLLETVALAWSSKADTLLNKISLKLIIFSVSPMITERLCSSSGWIFNTRCQ